MTEQEIIQRCKDNDRRGQEALYRKYLPVIKSMCLRYTQDEDRLISIINNGFLKVFKGIHQYKATGSFEGWIRRTVFNALSDYFRKENKYIKNTFFEVPDAGQQSEALADLFYADLLDIVEELPETTAMVFKKYAIEGYTHKEIGEILGFTDGTSKWHLFEARKKLKNLLKMKGNKLYGYVG